MRRMLELTAGWLKIYRKSRRSAVFSDPALWHLWSFLLMEARYEREQLPGGDWLEPGELIFVGAEYAAEFPASTSATSRRLRKLVNMGNCGIVTGRYGTKVTICNWRTYQDQKVGGWDSSGILAGSWRDPGGILDKKTVLVKEGKEGEETPLPPVDLPEDFNTPEVQRALGNWGEWLESIGKPSSGLANQMLVSRLASRGLDAPTMVEWIQGSISNSWKSVNDPSDKHTSGGAGSGGDNRDSVQKYLDTIKEQPT